MKSRDWFILIFTFFIGMFSGMYFYVTSYKPLYETSAVPDLNADTQALTVVGVTYGGRTIAGYVYPSFRIQSDRSYDYNPGGAPAGDVYEGIMSRDAYTAIESAIAVADLEFYATPLENKSCASYADGTEYAYTITYEGVTYDLDTCTTVFESSTQLGQTLREAWQYMNEPDTFRFTVRNYPSSDGESNSRTSLPNLREIIERYLNESFE